MIHLLFGCGLRDNDGATLQARGPSAGALPGRCASAWRGRAGAATRGGTRGTLPFHPDPAAPWVDSVGPRSDAGTSASAASGTTNEFSSGFWSSLIRSGYRFPGSTVTGEISCTPASNRKSATTCPVARSIAQTPQVLGQPLDNRDAAEDGALAHLRQLDEGEIPGEVEPAGEAQHLGDGHVLAPVRIDEPERPRPRFANSEPAGVPAWRVRHRQPAGDHLAGGHVHQ
jgi:hypothetical protein